MPLSSHPFVLHSILISIHPFISLITWSLFMHAFLSCVHLHLFPYLYPSLHYPGILLLCIFLFSFIPLSICFLIKSLLFIHSSTFISPSLSIHPAFLSVPLVSNDSFYPKWTDCMWEREREILLRVWLFPQKTKTLVCCRSDPVAWPVSRTSIWESPS